MILFHVARTIATLTNVFNMFLDRMANVRNDEQFSKRTLQNAMQIYLENVSALCEKRS